MHGAGWVFLSRRWGCTEAFASIGKEKEGTHPQRGSLGRRGAGWRRDGRPSGEGKTGEVAADGSRVKEGEVGCIGARGMGGVGQRVGWGQ